MPSTDWKRPPTLWKAVCFTQVHQLKCKSYLKTSKVIFDQPSWHINYHSLMLCLSSICSQVLAIPNCGKFFLMWSALSCFWVFTYAVPTLWNTLFLLFHLVNFYSFFKAQIKYHFLWKTFLGYLPPQSELYAHPRTFIIFSIIEHITLNYNCVFAFSFTRM